MAAAVMDISRMHITIQVAPFTQLRGINPHIPQSKKVNISQRHAMLNKQTCKLLEENSAVPKRRVKNFFVFCFCFSHVRS